MERNRASRITVVCYVDLAGVKNGVYKPVNRLVKVAVNAIVSSHAVATSKEMGEPLWSQRFLAQADGRNQRKNEQKVAKNAKETEEGSGLASSDLKIVLCELAVNKPLSTPQVLS